MTARYATPEEISHWNKHILANPTGGTVFASFEYTQIKQLTEYTPRFIFVDTLAITILEKKVPPLGSFWYIPKGPGVTTAEELIAACKALRPLAKKAGAFTIRTEAEIDTSNAPALQAAGMRPASPIIPSASTITVDMKASLDEILLALPQKGRHAIRRAERDGVTVSKVAVTEENARTMYQLIEETAKGQFGIRSFQYYKTYWETFAQAGYGQLFFASFEGKVVAGAYAMTFGTKSTYKDGASIRDRTAYGASHLLQWHVMSWAKARGSEVHDLCGSPPSDRIGDTTHPYYGIGRFKQSLSRTVVDYVGCYDYLISPLRWMLWKKAGERLYRHFYYKRTKDYFY